MIIGIPKEIKDQEYRVGATPSVVRALVENGHNVFVQTNAGERIGFSDPTYISAGAKIVTTAAEIYQAEMVIKVKEPQESEFPLMHEGQILFCFLHLAPDPKQTKRLLERKVIGIAYETVTDRFGGLPLLTPMSEVAGRIAVQVGATALQMTYGGKGILLGGVPGVPPANVVVLGGGVVGTQSARMAMGLGASVTIVDNSLSRLRALDETFGTALKTLYSTPWSIEKALIHADLVIGAVLLPGKTSPRIVTRDLLKKMEHGSVIVDVAIDQGGCAETSKPTTHSDPTYTVDGIVHYCVTNMPGACARTSTEALTNATYKNALAIANKGYKKALKEDPYLRMGLNVCLGYVTNEHVALDLGYRYHSPENFLD